MDLQKSRKLKFASIDKWWDRSRPKSEDESQEGSSSATMGDPAHLEDAKRAAPESESEPERQITTTEASDQNTTQRDSKTPNISVQLGPEAETKSTPGGQDNDTVWKENPMSDEVREWIDVWIEAEDETDAKPDQHEDLDSAFDIVCKIFEQYRHHHFTDSDGWITYKNDNANQGRDEEWFISDPTVYEESHPEYLCKVCRQIDFNVLLTQRDLPGNSRPGQTVIKVPGIQNLLHQPNCSFCSLLRQELEERCTPDELQEAKLAERGLRDMHLSVLDDGPGTSLRLEARFDNMKPRIVVQRLATKDEIRPLDGLEVHQNVANMERLRSWIETCEKDHLHDVSDDVHSLQPELTELRVIDVVDNCVATVAAPCRYACLSYVWGEETGTMLTSSTRETLERPGGLIHSSIKLGQTLQDAIKVTKEIGVRYLWIDALCILQDDAEDKSAIIGQMSLIYGKAVLTIVATTNSDPRGGLPGVGTVPRSRAQLVKRVQGQPFAVVFYDSRLPYNNIENSVWNSRAWTFQERHLSKRAVHFTQSQMFMTCPHQQFSEDAVPPSTTNPQTHLTLTGLADYSDFEVRIMDIMMHIFSDPTQTLYPNKYFRTKIFDEKVTSLMTDDPDPAVMYRLEPVPGGGDTSLRIKGNTLWKAYSDAVGMYTLRKMKWQSDATNAFTGVADLISQGINTAFWHGLPEFSFDQALLWYPRESLKRRTYPGASPSWSWAGWEGHVSYRGRGWHNAISIPPLSVVKWLEAADPQELIDKFKSRGDRTAEEIARFTALVTSQPTLLQTMKPRDLYHLDRTTGWIRQRDSARNEHYYTHPSYPNLRFHYPCSLPSEPLLPRCSADGTLYFQAHGVPARFTDMTTTAPNPAPRVETFLQIGLNDAARSIGRRPWEHIIYHQGYRAGYLSLNVPLSSLLGSSPDDEDDDEEDEDKYQLIAMSRDTIPHIAPPIGGWDMYWDVDLRDLQATALYDWEWDPEERAKCAEIGPHVGATAYTRPVRENGDPKWENGRFHNPSLMDVYNVLLVRKRMGRVGEEGTKRSWEERIGVGKMNATAFLHARPEMVTVILK